MGTPKPKPRMEIRLANSRGGRLGGKIRAERLSPDERKAIAQKAAQARWGKDEDRKTR